VKGFDCVQEALTDLQTFAVSWKHFVGYVQIMLPYQLLRFVKTALIASSCVTFVIVA